MSAKTKVLLDWAATLALAFLLSMFVRTYVAEAMWIPSGSMEPTLKVGDRLFIEKITTKLNRIQRGNIVVFNPPPASGKEDIMIKRVIGLPGDTLYIKGGVVYVNGQPLMEPYQNEKPLEDFKSFTVPENSLFMMGDNRNNSFDSRYWGVVPLDQVIGKALATYYPLKDAQMLNK